MDTREHHGGINEDDKMDVSTVIGNINTSETSPITALQKRTSSETSPDESDSTKFDRRKCSSVDRFDPWHVYGYIAKRSTLCCELAQILTQVSCTGRVNVKVFSLRSLIFMCWSSGITVLLSL